MLGTKGMTEIICCLVYSLVSTKHILLHQNFEVILRIEGNKFILTVGEGINMSSCSEGD